MSFRQDVHPHELLSPYLDGELEEKARAAIEAHLAGCSSCRVLVEDFRSMAASEAAEAPPPIPADLRGRIRLALDPKRASGGAVLGGWIWSYRLGLAAAAGVVMVIGLWALRQEPSPPVGTAVPALVVPDTAGDLESPGAGAGVAPPPVAPARPEEKETMKRFKSLGYTGAESPKKSEPVSPPPSAHQRLSDGALPTREAPAPPAASQGWEGKTTPPAQAVPKSGSGGSHEEAPMGEPEIARMQAARTAAGAPPSEYGAPSGRSLVVEFPAYRVLVFEDGTIALSAKGYSCAARRDGSSVDPDLAALFTLASSSGEGGSGNKGPAPAGGPVVRLVEPPAGAERASGAIAGVVVQAAKSIEIERRLRVLLQDRYLALIEVRCGPAPRAVRSP